MNRGCLRIWTTHSGYLNRELSQFRIFSRVLEEAKDASHPLLERVKFLAIVGSNLDEFFMVPRGWPETTDRRRWWSSFPSMV